MPNKEPMIFYSQDDIARVLLDFIKSKELDMVVSNIQDSSQTGFIAGLAWAGNIIMTKCHPYSGTIEEDNNNV